MSAVPNVTPIKQPEPEKKGKKKRKSQRVIVVFGISAIATIVGTGIIVGGLNALGSMSAAKMMPAPTANVSATVNVPKQPVQVIRTPAPPAPKPTIRTVVREVPVFVEVR